MIFCKNHSHLGQCLALWALVILGAYLRFDALDYNDLNSDEYGQTVPVARRIIDTGDFLGWSARPDVWYHFLPRLSFAFVALAVHCLGDTDGVMRLFPALFGTAAIPLFFAVARQQLKPYAALVCSFLFTISTMHIYHSREARYYAYVVFFALLVQFLAMSVIRSGPARRSWHLVGLAGTFMVAAMTHWFCLFFIAGTSVFLVGDRMRRRLARWSTPQKVALLGLIGVLAVAVLAAFGAELTEVTRSNGGWKARVSAQSKGFELCVLMTKIFSNAGHQVSRHAALYYNQVSVFLAWGLSTAAVLGLLAAVRSRPRFAILTLLWFIPPVFAIWLVNPEHFVTAKYLIFVLPMFFMCVSLAVDRFVSFLNSRSLPSQLHSHRIYLASHTLLAVVVGLLTWPAISSARFHFVDRYKEVARRILTEMPGDIALCNISRVPAESHWKHRSWFDGSTHTLLPRYLEHDGTSRTSLELKATPRWPISQISSFDEWCQVLKTLAGSPVVVFGVGDRQLASNSENLPGDYDHRDARLVSWIRTHRLCILDVGTPTVVEPLLQPTPDVIWTTVASQTQASDVGLSNNRRLGVRVGPGNDFNVAASFYSAGHHAITLAVAAPFPGLVEFHLELDGRDIKHAVLHGPANQVCIVTANFSVDRPGRHDLRISVVPREHGVPTLWIDFLRVESLDTPRKYVMPGFGVAALCINAGDGSHRTWAITTSLDQDLARDIWRSLESHTRELPPGSLVVLVCKGPVGDLIDVGQSHVQAILADIGGKAELLDRIRSQSGLLLVGAKNTSATSLRLWPLPESTARFWNAGQELVSGAMPLPWPIGVANTSPVSPLRDPSDAAFQVPMSFVPGVFFLPASIVTSRPHGMVDSYVESSVRNEVRLKSRFFRTVDEHRKHILTTCLKPQSGAAEPTRVISFDRFVGGTLGRRYGFPLKRVVVFKPGWITLQEASVSGLRPTNVIHLVMQIDHPERVDEIQFILRTPTNRKILWCPVPKYPEQSIAFDCSFDAFNVKEKSQAPDVVSAELRLKLRGRGPVQVDIYDLCIVDDPRIPWIPG